jgi:hypothetical protein
VLKKVARAKMASKNKAEKEMSQPGAELSFAGAAAAG